MTMDKISYEVKVDDILPLSISHDELLWFSNYRLSMVLR